MVNPNVGSQPQAFLGLRDRPCTGQFGLVPSGSSSRGEAEHIVQNCAAVGHCSILVILQCVMSCQVPYIYMYRV